MDGYQAGKLAKIAFFGTAMLALGLQTCGKTIDSVPARLEGGIAATKDIAADLVADNVDAEMAANASVKVAQFAQAMDKAGTPVTADRLEARLYASTLYDVISKQNLRRICDREKPTEPELGPTRPSVAEAFDRQLIADGFAVPEGRKREIALSNVNRLRTELTVCLYRDAARALADGSPYESVQDFLRIYRDRSNNTPVDLEGYREHFAKRDELIERLTETMNGNAASARATILARLSENAIRRYPSLKADLQVFVENSPLAANQSAAEVESE